MGCLAMAFGEQTTVTFAGRGGASRVPLVSMSTQVNWFASWFKVPRPIAGEVHHR